MHVRCAAYLVLTMIAFAGPVFGGDTPPAASAPATPTPATAPAVAPAIVPRPVDLQTVAETYVFNEQTALVYSHGKPELKPIAEYAADRINDATGRKPAIRELPDMPSRLPQGTIMIILVPGQEDLGPEGYAMTVGAYGVMLSANEPAGLFHATQTLRQLMSRGADGAWRLSGVRIRDYPRYRWRGMLLDCCRHFMPKDFVKRYIDLLAYHKMNVLHWHLTEDQGWRIEIKKYPKLTEVGAWRKITRDSELPQPPRPTGVDPKLGFAPPPPLPSELPPDEIARLAGEKARYGGFFTQDDVREIVAYAASRFVTIVPEIEMPGHSLAALASYPEYSCAGKPVEVGTTWGVIDNVYCAGNDATFEFLQDVLTEIIALFPSEYIHVGGDECPKDYWKTCPKCQARIKAEALKDETELQSYFIRRIERFLSSKGKRLVGWDEILEGGLAPNATVQSWRGMDGAIAAARSGHDVVSSPTSHCYLDYPQAPVPGDPAFFATTTLEKSYSFEPTPPELTADQAAHVLGLEGNLWSERAPYWRVDWQVFPRLCALAEVGWSPKDARDAADFAGRMDVHLARLDALGVTYCVPPPSPVGDDFNFADTFELKFAPPARAGVIRYTLDGSPPTATSRAYEKPISISDTCTVNARLILPNGRSSDLLALRVRKLRPIEAVAAAETQPGLHWACYPGHWLRVPDFRKLTPAAQGVAETPSPTVGEQKKDYALVFEGFIAAPADGVYTFFLNSDDGSRLYVHDDLLIDNDGLHAAAERSGKLMLKDGRHPIRIEYFQGDGAAKLELRYAVGGEKPQAVSKEMLSH